MKYNVIILAPSTRGALHEEYGCLNKALFPIHGKPMLDWVVEAFAESEQIDNIIVVGPDALDQLSCMRHVRKRVMEGINVVQNLIHGFTYIKTALYGFSDQHTGYLISFCDAPLLNTAIINDTIANIAASDAELALHYVERSVIAERGWALPSSSPVIVGGKQYYDGSIYYISRFGLAINLLNELSALRRQAQNPQGILKDLGCENASALSDIEPALSRKTGARVRIFESPHPEMATDVDTPDDVTLARAQLASPWKHEYRKARIIYNPNAGQGMQLSPIFKDMLGIKRRRFEVLASTEEYVNKIKEYLSSYNIEAEPVPTQAAGHATELAATAVAEDYDLVIAAGGDGTINEVVNGLAGSRVTLGVIPLGTANVFSLEMRLPVEIKAACQVIASGRTRRIDLGRANGRFFICMAGIGFDAHVLKEADSKLKKIYGALAYGIVGLTQILTYPFRQMVIEIDGEPVRRRGYFIVVGNGKYYGGEMMFATRADLTDGLLDVCLFKHRNLFGVLRFLFGLHRGQIEGNLSLEYVQCKKVRIFKKGKHPVHVDAEYLCETPVDIEVCPASLTVAV